MRAERALAALLVALWGTAGAAELGTLFHSPEERERLDKLRRGEPLDQPAPAAEPPRRPSTVTGYVQRSDGRGTVWIDGKPYALREGVAAPVPGTRDALRGVERPIDVKPSP